MVCALINIIVTSPLWIIGIVGILVSDWGPVFYTVICILYAVCGKECTWILKEFLNDARETNPEIDVMPREY